MKLLSRYILGNILSIFLTALTLLSGGVGLFIIIEAAFKRGIPVLIALKLLPYAVPEIMTMTLPITILLACCFFYARIAGSNELIAMKTMGIAPWRVMLPTWIFVFLLSLLGVWLNDQSISWGRFQMARVVIEGTEDMILSKLRTDGKFTVPDNSFTLEVRRVEEDGLLVSPFLSSKGEFRGRAKTARLLLDFKSEPPTIRFHFTGAYMENDMVGVSLPSDFDYNFPIDKLLRRNYSGDPPMSKIAEELEMIEKERETLRRRLAAKAMFGLATGNDEVFKDQEWISQVYREDSMNYRRNQLMLAIPRRWASGFACFFFVWVGIPLAILVNRADYFSSFFICFIPILLVYYPLLMFGFEGVKNGTLPPAFAWTGNIVLGIIGIWLIALVHKH